MTTHPPHLRSILVVEDEPSIRDNLVWSLESEGFAVTSFPTCGEALTALGTGRFHLAILDIGLPDGSGLDVCRELRKTSDMPVIFLTARADEIDRVVGLEIGGDDYVTKPFSPRELTARVRAVLRRVIPESATHPTGRIEPADPHPEFSINEERCEIRFCGQALELSRYEYRLLKTLIARPGRVFSRAQLMDEAWEEPEASLERTVDSHIKSLRAKLHAVQKDADPIRTHRGLGYSLASPSCH
jgi:two-component system catabolic regulation response regulator CreB